MITIRPSSLTSYSDCPRRTIARTMPLLVEDAGFKLREVASHIGANVGTGTHAAVAHFLIVKMKTGTLGTAEAAEDAGIASLREEAKKGVMFDETTPDLNTGEKQIRRQADAYRRLIAPHVEPVMVEERLEAQFGDLFLISGQVDVATDGIRDLKTGKHHSIHMPQLGAYSLLLKAHGQESKFIIEDYVPRGPLNKEQGDPISTKYDAALTERVAKSTILRMARDVKEFQESGDPLVFAANPSSMLCSAKFCSAHGTKWCQEHKTF